MTVQTTFEAKGRLYTTGKVIRYDFLKLNFHILLPKLDYFFVEKREPKIFGFRNVMALRIRKCVPFVIRQISSKIFGKITLKPL